MKIADSVLLSLFCDFHFYILVWLLSRGRLLPMLLVLDVMTFYCVSVVENKSKYVSISLDSVTDFNRLNKSMLIILFPKFLLIK